MRCGARESGGLATLPDDATALTLRGTTPHTVTLAVGHGVLQACLPHGAARADALGLLGLFVGDRIEDVGVNAPAGGVLPPGEVHSERHLEFSTVSNSLPRAHG